MLFFLNGLVLKGSFMWVGGGFPVKPSQVLNPNSFLINVFELVTAIQLYNYSLLA